MLGADDEVGIQRPRRGGVRAVAGELVQEAGREAEAGSGSTGSLPGRRRANAASADGETAVSARACSAVGGQTRCCVAPHAETAVRRASIGLARRRAARAGPSAPRSGSGPAGELRAGHSPVQSSSATCA